MGAIKSGCGFFASASRPAADSIEAHSGYVVTVIFCPEWLNFSWSFLHEVFHHTSRNDAFNSVLP
jgi:hypothetical protein